MKGMPQARWWTVGLVLVLAGTSGCASLMASVGTKASAILSAGILDQEDPDTVREGLPAYLLLLDGLIHDSPDNEAMLIAGAKLNGAYAGQFIKEPERAKKMATKAFDYGLRALCGRRSAICAARSKDFPAFEAALAGTTKDDVPALYAAGAAWAGWIQASADDLDAVADVARVNALMERVVAQDETVERGSAHMYLGVIATLVPPAYGGKPEEGRAHFERAIALSQGRNLMAKVLFAKCYARLIFERELHDTLLREVLAADPREPGLTLVNVIAQREAAALLASGDDYF
jgi:hypothetical protein